MEDLIISKSYKKSRTKTNHRKEPKSKKNAIDNPTKQMTTNDIIEKETCSQSAQNVHTLNLTRMDNMTNMTGENIFYTPPTISSLLNKKTERPQDSSVISSYYRKVKKIKVDTLEKEKNVLIADLASNKNKALVSIIDIIPTSLKEFKDIIIPSYISLIDLDGSQSYSEYLASQIETLNDIYLFHDTQQNNRELFKQQYDLYCFFIKVNSFIDRLKSYYDFLSKIK